jgi:lipopolysaccharide export system protein LptA
MPLDRNETVAIERNFAKPQSRGGECGLGVGEAAASPHHLMGWGGAASPPKLLPQMERAGLPGKLTGWQVLSCTILFFTFIATVFAQPRVQISVAGKWVEHVPQDPPNQLRDKYVLTAESGQGLPPGPNNDVRALLKDFKIEEFSLTDTNSVLTARSPECIYDHNLAQVSSLSSLNVVAQQGRMVTDGVGFLLDQKISTLFISNKVHSVIQDQSSDGRPSTNFTDITSDEGRFLTSNENASGSAFYLGHVRAEDKGMQLFCGHLTADAPKQAAGVTNRLNKIVADTNVVIEFVTEKGEHVHATGDHSVYTHTGTNGVDDELLELSGNPVVSMTNNWMTADVFYYDRAAGLLRGSNNFVLHYFSAPAGGTAELPQGASNAVVSSSQFLMEVNTHTATFWDGVRADDASKTLACEYMTAKLTGSNRIDEVVAQTNVVIVVVDGKSKQRVHTTSQKAVYTSPVENGVTNEVLVLTETPEALFKDGVMDADTITLDKLAGRIRGEGNQHTVLHSSDPAAPSQNVEIFSERVEVATDTGISVYEKNVRAYSPQMTHFSDKMIVKPPKSGAPNAGRPESIQADGNAAIKYATGPFFPGDITNLIEFDAVLSRRRAHPDTAKYGNDLRSPRPTTQEWGEGQGEGQSPRSFDAPLPNPSPARSSRGEGEKAPIVAVSSTSLQRLNASDYVAMRIPTLHYQPLLHISGAQTNSQLQSFVITDLNKLVLQENLAGAVVWSGVDFSTETRRALALPALGEDRFQLNRLLLLDLFRGALRRNEKGDEVRAWGDHSLYTCKTTAVSTNETLRLTGHPRLETDNGSVTATQAIIDDLTAGVTHFEGQSHFHAKPEALTSPGMTGKQSQSQSRPKNGKQQ